MSCNVNIISVMQMVLGALHKWVLWFPQMVVTYMLRIPALEYLLSCPNALKAHVSLLTVSLKWFTKLNSGNMSKSFGWT